MGDISIWWFVGVGGFVLLVLAVRWLAHFGKMVMAERARELFRLQHERFEEMLLKAASETGKPRGLRWLGCSITGDAVLVRDTATRQIVALVPVLLTFEPIEGSDMEDVSAARDPRPATALFTFEKGHWHTTGRIVMNHTPHQAIAAFGTQFKLIEHH